MVLEAVVMEIEKNVRVSETHRRSFSAGGDCSLLIEDLEEDDLITRVLNRSI